MHEWCEVEALYNHPLRMLRNNKNYFIKITLFSLIKFFYVAYTSYTFTVIMQVTNRNTNNGGGKNGMATIGIFCNGSKT